MFLGRKYNAHVLTMRKRGRADDGYVQVFVNLDNGYNREDSVKDIGALLDCTCFVFFAWVRLCCGFLRLDVHRFPCLLSVWIGAAATRLALLEGVSHRSQLWQGSMPMPHLILAGLLSGVARTVSHATQLVVRCTFREVPCRETGAQHEHGSILTGYMHA